MLLLWTWSRPGAPGGLRAGGGIGGGRRGARRHGGTQVHSSSEARARSGNRSGPKVGDTGTASWDAATTSGPLRGAEWANQLRQGAQLQPRGKRRAAGTQDV